MPDGVQPADSPDTGQGTEGQGDAPQPGGLYDSMLEGIPEQYHGTLTERLKAQDADVTKRFQSQSETWKPYENLGVRDVDPEQLGSYINLGNALNAAAEGDAEAVEAIKGWVGDLTKTLGFDQTEQEPGQAASDLLDLTPDQLKEMVADAVNPIQERLDQQEQQQAVAEAEAEVQDKLSSLRKDNPNLTDDDEKRILAFAYMFGQESEDPIAAGFEEFKQVAARGENELFAQKSEQPNPAEGAGRPNTVPPEITSFEDAAEAAKERMRQTVGT